MVLGFVTGCAHSLRPSNSPSQQRLRIESASTDKLAIRVSGATYEVPQNGRVTFEVPPLERGCAWYLFGVVKVRDSSAFDVKAIQITKSSKILKEVSLNQIARLPVDEEGYHVIRIR